MPQMPTLEATYNGNSQDRLVKGNTLSTGDSPGIIAILLGHWRLLAVAGVVSAAIAFAVGREYSLKTWHAEGTLLYSPFPVPDNLRGDYNPASSQTLIQLVKSRKNIERLRQEFHLQVPHKTFDKIITVNQPSNAELVAVTLDWAEPEIGAALINRLMELHIEHVAQLRKAKVAESMKSLEGSFERARKKVVERRKSYEDFEARSHVRNISLELDRLQREATALEQLLAGPRTTLRSTLNQQGKLHELVDALATGAAVDADNIDRNSNGRSYSTRRTIVRDALQAAEFRYIESAKEFDAKAQRYNTVKSQARLNIISKTELDQVKADMELARTRRDNNQAAVQQHKDELKSLPSSYTQARKAELGEQVEAIKLEIAHVEKLLTIKRGEIQEMARLQIEAEPYTKATREANEEVLQISAQIAALERMNMSDANEFVIETPAVASDHATTSNRKKLTLASFSLPMILLMGGIILFERRGSLPQSRGVRRDGNHRAATRD